MADQESTDHDGSRVDHGVVRPPTLIEDRCIKYVPARLLSNPLMYFLTAYLITNEGIGEYFWNRLHRKFNVNITNLRLLVICRAEARREPFWVSFRQMWDIGSNMPTLELIIGVFYYFEIGFLIVGHESLKHGQY